MQAQGLERFVKEEIPQRKEEGYDVEEIEGKSLESEEKSHSELEELQMALENGRLGDDRQAVCGHVDLRSVLRSISGLAGG